MNTSCVCLIKQKRKRWFHKTDDFKMCSFTTGEMWSPLDYHRTWTQRCTCCWQTCSVVTCRSLQQFQFKCILSVFMGWVAPWQPVWYEVKWPPLELHETGGGLRTMSPSHFHSWRYQQNHFVLHTLSVWEDKAQLSCPLQLTPNKPKLVEAFLRVIRKVTFLSFLLELWCPPFTSHLLLCWTPNCSDRNRKDWR